MMVLWRLSATGLLLGQLAHSIPLDLSDPESIKSAASTVAYGLAAYYSGNQTGQTPGLLPYPPYYWWESGAMFNSLINYWYYTGDPSYNDMVMQGLLFQVGPGDAYMPPNQTFDEGNDDQMFWGFSAMTAAEYNFPNPPTGQPQWLELAQGVFNTQAFRWDPTSCGGGLHWQFNPYNPGYPLKNSPVNGGFFNLAARLGAYTKNQTYIEWAEKTWDWLESVGLISPLYVIFDNTNTGNNCTTIDHAHWSYSSGIILNGASVMWNVTQNPIWQYRAERVFNSSTHFFFVDNPPMVMRELCEPVDACNTDQLSFKAYYSRFMAASTKVAPWMYDLVKPYLAQSALAAAAQCSGGENQTVCGTKWYQLGDWDGTSGVGQQMSALEVIQANLIHHVAAPVTAKTGGTSEGNPDAGTNVSPAHIPTVATERITAGDRAGAAILTVLMISGMLAGAWWMVVSRSEPLADRDKPIKEKSIMLQGSDAGRGTGIGIGKDEVRMGEKV